jgi:hypothetical protein
MKRNILFFSIIIIFLGYATYQFYKMDKNVRYESSSSPEYKTYQKRGEELVSFDSTEDELNFLPPGQINQPPKVASPETDATIFQGRRVIGLKNPVNVFNFNYTFKNEIDPNWEEALGRELLRFQNENTKVLIKKEGSLIQIENEEARYVEKVLITFIFTDKPISSFHAFVDSSNGKVLRTWDRPISDGPMRETLELVPTGTL